MEMLNIGLINDILGGKAINGLGDFQFSVNLHLRGDKVEFISYTGKLENFIASGSDDFLFDLIFSNFFYLKFSRNGDHHCQRH